MSWFPTWPPRDWRMLLALVFLAGGGMAVTALAAAALYSLGWMDWPAVVAPARIRWLGYFGISSLGLIAIVLTSFGFVLGRRAWKVKAGSFDASAEGGEETAPAGALDGGSRG